MSAISVSKPNHGVGFLILTFVGIMLAAMNLRPTLTSVSPLLNLLGSQLGLSSSGLGVLTTLPVLCLGLTAPLTPALVRRIGQERSVILVLVILIAALIVRPYIGSAGFFVGTAVAGGAFAMALTLLALRAANVESAGQLSAMAQGFGYVLAAFGPLAVGLIHDVFSWAATGVLLGAIGILALIFGLYAGRNLTVDEDQ